MPKQPPIDQIISELDNSITPEEKLQLEEWQKESSENISFLKTFRFIWLNTGSNPFTPNTEKALLAVNQKIYRRRIMRWTATVAALFILSLITGLGLHLLSNQSEIIHTIAEQQQTIILPDQSKVVLAKGSQITYPQQFGSGKRTVKLEGKAWFKVQHHLSYPFVVETPHGKTTVLGTTFTLRDDEESTLQLFLDEGKVEFKSNKWLSKSLLLAPGEMICQVNSKYIIHPQPNLNASAWATNVLNFQNTPLSQVIDELEKFYKITISLKQKQITELRFSGRLKETEAQAALEIVALTLKLKLTKEATSFSLSL